MLVPSPLRFGNKFQQPAKERVHARYDCKESQDDYEHDARRLKHGGEGRPSHSFEFRKGFLKLCAYATKPVGFLVLGFSCVSHLVPLDAPVFCKTRDFQRLFGFFMFRMLSAERAVLGKSKSVRVVLLILQAVIISMLAFGTFKGNFSSCRFGCHSKTPYKKITPSLRRVYRVYHTLRGLSILFERIFEIFFAFL